MSLKPDSQLLNVYLIGSLGEDCHEKTCTLFRTQNKYMHLQTVPHYPDLKGSKAPQILYQADALIMGLPKATGQFHSQKHFLNAAAKFQTPTIFVNFNSKLWNSCVYINTQQGSFKAEDKPKILSSVLTTAVDHILHEDVTTFFDWKIRNEYMNMLFKTSFAQTNEGNGISATMSHDVIENRLKRREWLCENYKNTSPISHSGKNNSIYIYS